MVIRTFYWEGQKRPIYARICDRGSDNRFNTGNAGDLFAKDVINIKYNTVALNTCTSPRLLCIGSIAHKVLPGDILCGVGVKDRSQVPSGPMKDVKIIGLRGPLTARALSAAGFGLQDLRFQLDPGLLIKNLFSAQELAQSGKEIVFIPHYRERASYRRRPIPEVQFVDIDNFPFDVAKRILGARLVLSSSLHGIIFAHALGRPAIMIRPETEESLFKFEDYYLSIGSPMPRPLDRLDLRLAARLPDSPVTLPHSDLESQFPSLAELIVCGIAQ